MSLRKGARKTRRFGRCRCRHFEILAFVLRKPHIGGMPNQGDAQPAIRVLMMPKDTNALGTIFGGFILNHLDVAGLIEAKRHTPRKLVTVAMHEVKFVAPVFVGDLVSFYTETLKIGTTSITVRVTVDATRFAEPHENVQVTHAEIVYVAVDGNGKAVPVR